MSSRVSTVRRDEWSEVWEGLGKLFGGILIIVVMAVIAAVVAWHYWVWFVAPVFGVRVLTGAEAYGLMLVAGLMRGYRSQPKGHESQPFGRQLAEGLFFWILYFLVGWLAHQAILAGW